MHICSNETIGGVEYPEPPDVGAVPLGADMSSSILSRPVEVAKYGLIFGLIYFAGLLLIVLPWLQWIG